MTGVNISTCWLCRQRIHSIRHKWRHKESGLAYSLLNGDHYASPFDPQASAGENPPQPAENDAPPDRDNPRHRKGGASP